VTQPLPDVDESGYDQWQNQLYTEDTERKIQGIGFTHQANDRIADLARIGVWAETSAPEGPPPPPAAEAVPEAPPEAVASAAPAAAPVASPTSRGAALSPTSSAAAPSPAPASGAGDWLQNAFQAATSAGADAGAFLTGLGTGSGDRALDAMNAVIQAGGDVDRFLQNMRPAAVAPATGGAPVPGGPLQDYARQVAQKAGVDPDVFVRQIQQESGFNPNARSPAGATGVAQIVPQYHPGVDASDPYASLDYAANLMKSNLGKYGGDYAKALAAYNAGGGAVDKYGGVPPFEETQRYVSTILGGKTSPLPTAPEGLARAGAALGEANKSEWLRLAEAQIGKPYIWGSGSGAGGRGTGDIDPATGIPRGFDCSGFVSYIYENALGIKLPAQTASAYDATRPISATEARPGDVVLYNMGDPDPHVQHIAIYLGDGKIIQSGGGVQRNVNIGDLGGPGSFEFRRAAGAETALGNVKASVNVADHLDPSTPPPEGAAPGKFLDNMRQDLADSLAPSKPTKLEGEAVSPERSSVISNISSTLGIGPDQQAAAVGEARPIEVAGEQSRNPLQVLGDTIGGGLRSLGIGGEAAQPVNAPGGGYDPSALRAVTEPSQPGLPVRQDVRDLGIEPQPTIVDQATQALGLDEASRAARQAQIEANRPTSQGLVEDVGQAVIERSAQEREAPGQLYGADIAAGQALADTTVARAKAMGWQADPDTERFVHDALATATPSNVLLSVLTAGEGPALLQLVRGTASIIGAGVGGQGAKTLAQQVGLPEGVQVGAELLGGLAGGIAAPLGVNRSARALEYLRTPEGQALLRTRQQAEFSLDPEGARAAEAAKRPSNPLGRVPEIPERPLPEGARPIELTPGQEVERLRLEQFPEEVRPAIQEAAENVDFARQQRRGVIPDEEANRLAEEWAQDHTLDQVIRQGVAGKAYNAEDLRALQSATGAQAARVADAAAAIQKGDDSSAALQLFWNEQEKLQRLVTIAEGGRAEWGRAGRAFNQPVRLIDLAPNDAVAQISKLLGGDRDRLVQAIGEYQKLLESGAGPIKQAQFWSDLKNPPMKITNPDDWLEWLKAIRYNSMLSGPRTAEINSISFLAELPWRLARDAGASALRGRLGEIGPEAKGILAGLGKANQAFMDTLSSGISAEQAARGELPKGLAQRVRNPVGKAVATAIDAPGRVLGAADQWALAIAQHMALGRRAGQIASREGLDGAAWNQRVAEILNEPSLALSKEANQIAERMVFHGDMGNFGRALEGLSRVPLIGNLLLPFVRTVYQISTRGIERSPLGLVGTGIDVARGAYGPRTKEGLAAALRGEGPRPKGVTPLGERLGDNVMGTALFIPIYMQAQAGNISGAGPDNPADRNLLRSEGWQPYSVKIGNQWVSYANWGPMSIPLSMAAAAAETQKFAKPGADAGDLIVDGVRRTGQLATEQTYLQGIGMIYKGLTEPERYGASAVNNLVTSLVPYGSALNTLAQAQDPTQRKVEGFNALQAIQSRLPPDFPLIGGREEVPEAQDVLGRPVPNPRQGLGALNPLQVNPVRPDPVLEELDNVGVTVAPPPKVVTRGGVPLELKPEESRDLQARSGALVAERIAAEIAEPGYQRLSQTDKAWRLERIIERARTEMRNQWLNALSNDEYERRVREGKERSERIPVSGR